MKHEPHASHRVVGPTLFHSQSSRASRLGLMLLAGLVLALCTALLAASIHASNPQYVVVLCHSGRRQLEAWARRGLRIVSYYEDTAVAVCSEGEIAQLKQAGTRPKVLARIEGGKQLYLAYHDSAEQRAFPDGAFESYAYGSSATILQLDANEAEALARQGADIVRLPAAIRFPDQGPASARVASLRSETSIESMVQAVSPTLLVHHVCKLQDRDALGYCNELGTRYSFASAGLAEAAEYLSDTYASYGLDVTFDPFTFNSTPMTNVVAELPGSGTSSNHIFMLTAHYDSISPRPYDAAPGADDNASGVAAVLEVARILSKHEFPCTLRFVNFAGEEQGLIGSAHYAAQSAGRGEIIDGVLNLDMIAYESVPPSDHNIDIHAGTDPRSIALAEALRASILDLQLGLAPQVITAGATWRSDHGSFWSQGFPAILGIEDMDDFNPHYHSERDTRSRIQTALLNEFTKASLATMARLAAQSYEPLQTPTPVPTTTPTATLTPTPTDPPPTPALRRIYLPLVRSTGR